ncbi:translation initiation factor eIF3 subunit [Serendipita vermifera]|nr:translation initiation factor eIF3 subunit [Serendipita vermifera]
MSDLDGSVKREARREEGEKNVASDWDAPSGDEKGNEKTSAEAVTSKKKGNLKQKLAEKEGSRRQRLENGEFEDEYLDLRDKWMDEKEMKRIMRERELEADMQNATDLFGAAAIDASRVASTLKPTPKDSDNEDSGKSSLPPHLAPFVALPSRIQNKTDFELLSKLTYTNLVQPHSTSSHYSAFVEHHVKLLCSTMKEAEIKKLSAVVAGIATTKAAEARKAKQKPKGPAGAGGKSSLAGGKGKYDAATYDDGYDDFGNDPDDFM